MQWVAGSAGKVSVSASGELGGGVRVRARLGLGLG